MTNKNSIADVIALMRGQPNFRALPSRGRISASDINTELGRPATSRLSLNDAGARELAGKPHGRIAYSDFHGKVLLTAPRFTEQPKATSVTEGQRATFTARAVDSGTGSGHISYQWYVNNSPVHGATGTSFSINANINDNNKSIKCKASNRKGSVFSETVLLTVRWGFTHELRRDRWGESDGNDNVNMSDIAGFSAGKCGALTPQGINGTNVTFIGMIAWGNRLALGREGIKCTFFDKQSRPYRNPIEISWDNGKHRVVVQHDNIFDNAAMKSMLCQRGVMRIRIVAV